MPSPVSKSSSSNPPFRFPETTVGKKPAIDEPTSLPDPDFGPLLLQLARETIISGDNPNKALDYATRACASLELCSGRALELAMSLHVLAAIYRHLGRFDDATRVLERAIAVSDLESGSDHALAKFLGYMRLGDTFFMLGQLDRSITCYKTGLRIQIETLGDRDPRVADTCRYLAETYVQAMQFDEAEAMCRKTLEIQCNRRTPISSEEGADHRLMALIYEAKGQYESALEYLILASVSMVASGQDHEVASINISIGNIYLSLCRLDEAAFAFQKALAVLKSVNGESHPCVASVLIRLANLHYKTGKLRECRSYCENALRMYTNPVPGTSSDEIAKGLIEISAIFEALNEHEQALWLLNRAMKLLEDEPRNNRIVAGIEAQMGVVFYTVGRYRSAQGALESAVTKLRELGEHKSAFFAIMLNQMGLACVQLYRIGEASALFEEAHKILKDEYGSRHPDTLSVYSNLAATYDVMGRVEDAIGILDHIVKVRRESLGTANPDFIDEKKRLAELLKEAGRARNHRRTSLERLLDPNPRKMKTVAMKRWPGIGPKS